MLYASIVDIKRFAVHDGPGIRTTIFLKGCPLRCIWCHNPESYRAAPELAYYAHKCVGCGNCQTACPNGAHSIINGIHSFERVKCDVCGKCIDDCAGEALKLYGKKLSVDEILKVVLEDKSFYETSGGGVTLSGGEPLMQADFCLEFLRKAKAAELQTAIDTCGAVRSDAIKSVAPDTDIFLYDIKQMDSNIHRQNTGLGNELILENLRLLAKLGTPVEIRIPLIPGINDSDENLDAVGRFLAGMKNITRVKLLPYHSLARSKYAAVEIDDTMPDVASPDDAVLDAAAKRIETFGINAVSGKRA